MRFGWMLPLAGLLLGGCLSPVEWSPVNVALGRKCGEATTYGLDVPLAEISSVTTYGVALCPTISEKYATYGVQGSLLMSTLKGPLQGVQVGIGTSLNGERGEERSHGVQLGLLQNLAYRFSGVQFGASNASDGALNGAQVSLVGNYAQMDGDRQGLNGLQATVLYNFTNNLRGAQVGAINVSSYFKGVQVGIKNRSTYAPKGLQFGLFNVVNSEKPDDEGWDEGWGYVQIGLLNWGHRGAGYDGPIPLLRFHFRD